MVDGSGPQTVLFGGFPFLVMLFLSKISIITSTFFYFDCIFHVLVTVDYYRAIR